MCMALSSTQKIILDELAKSPLKERFYWSGGTLLAEKYLYHRHSYDTVNTDCGRPATLRPIGILWVSVR